MSVRSLNELLAKLYDVETTGTLNPVVATVGTSPVAILRNNPQRVQAYVVNLSLNRVYVGPSWDVSATKGIRLDPNGGFWSVVYYEDFHAAGWEWVAVADAAASPILVFEGTVI